METTVNSDKNKYRICTNREMGNCFEQFLNVSLKTATTPEVWDKEIYCRCEGHFEGSEQFKD